FNTMYRMPAPLWAETRDFAALKLAETRLIESSGASQEEAGRVISVLQNAYLNNPRRVIQFLNRVCSHWQLIEVTARGLRRDEIATELGSIAKCVALQDRWPMFASRVVHRPSQLVEAEQLSLDGGAIELGLK